MFSIEQLKQLSDFLIKDFKDVFVTKEDITVLDTKIMGIQNSLDNMAKITLKNEQEILVMGERVNNHENWIKKASLTTGIDLEV